MRHYGFSCWELLALGTVSCVVGALLLPVIAKTSPETRVSEDERAETCLNNLKQVALGVAQYVNDFDERYPIVVVNAATRPNGASPYGWADALQPYIRNTSVYQCPSDRHAAQDEPMLSGYTDYWFNKNMAGKNMSALRSPILSLTLGDGDGGVANANARYNLNQLPKSWHKTAKSPARRHLDKGTYVFADGHIERLKPNEVGTRQATFIESKNSRTKIRRRASTSTAPSP